MKIRKNYVETRIKESIEAKGGTFIKINWNHRNVHFLTPTNVKKIEHIGFSFR